MAANDDVAYIPYLFNYVNYSMGDDARRIVFGAPRRSPKDCPRAQSSAAPGSGSAPARRTPRWRSIMRCICAPQLPVDRICERRRSAGEPLRLAVGRVQPDFRRVLSKHAAGAGSRLSAPHPIRVSCLSFATRPCCSPRLCSKTRRYSRSLTGLTIAMSKSAPKRRSQRADYGTESWSELATLEAAGAARRSYSVPAAEKDPGHHRVHGRPARGHDADRTRRCAGAERA